MSEKDLMGLFPGSSGRLFGFLESRVQKKLHKFFKEIPTHWFLECFGFIGFFAFSFLNEQLESLLVDLAHQLSFLFRLSENLEIHYILVVRSCKHR